MTRKTLLALNGALRGDAGNTGRALADAVRRAPPHVAVTTVALCDWAGTTTALVDLVARADGLLLATGTYWSSWGSPLQRFLEVLTPHEASPVLLGKPVAALVTMDSVGGVEVGTRLLGALALMGCLVPPLPLVVLSRTGTAVAGRAGFEDVWQLDDLQVTVDNLVAALESPRDRYRAWPVEKARLQDGPLHTAGPVDHGLGRFIK